MRSCESKYSTWLPQNAEVDADFESLKTLQKSSPQKVIRWKTLHKVIKVKNSTFPSLFVNMKLFSHELFPLFLVFALFPNFEGKHTRNGSKNEKNYFYDHV